MRRESVKVFATDKIDFADLLEMDTPEEEARALVELFAEGDDEYKS